MLYYEGAEPLVYGFEKKIVSVAKSMTDELVI
jgi:hypothetical protein